MWHMIEDNLQAYLEAEIDLYQHLKVMVNQRSEDQDWTERNDLIEVVRIRKDGLMSIINIAINRGPE
jgi:hypothetical protein